MGFFGGEKKLKAVLKTTLLLATIAVLGLAVLFMRGMSDGAETVHPAARRIVEAVYATGEVEPVVWTKVSPQATVRLEKILADERTEVVKGQTLALADDSVERAKLAEYESRRGQLENDLKRNRALAAKGFASSAALDATESAYRETLARIDGQKKILERMAIASPLDGVVLRRDAEEGEVKTAGQPIFWIGQLLPLRIEAEVDEEDILRIRKGQKALVSSDAAEGALIEGFVDAVTPKGDPVNKNFRVYISLQDDQPLRIGMTAEINIVTDIRENILTVPAAALEDGHVMLLADGKATRTPVKTGYADGETVEILSGLGPEDSILALYPK